MDIEFNRFLHLPEFIPGERHRYRCADSTPEAIRRNDTLACADTVDIDKHPALAGFLLDVQCGVVGKTIYKGPRNILCRIKYFREILLCRQRTTDVNALSTGGFDKRRVSIAFNMFFEVERQGNDVCKCVTLRRIKVEHHVIRLVELRAAAVQLMKFQSCE